MRVYKTEGIIIKRSNFSEADRILTVFSRQHGKIKVIAKGVRRITSKRSGNVELLNLTEITLHEGHNFDILTEASVVNSFSGIKNNLTKIGYAYHLCEIVDGLCAERQESPAIFRELVKTLKILNSGEDRVPGKEDKDAVYNFEVFLLRELGFWPGNELLPPEKLDDILEEILEKKLKSKKFLQKIG